MLWIDRAVARVDLEWLLICSVEACFAVLARQCVTHE